MSLLCLWLTLFYTFLTTTSNAAVIPADASADPVILQLSRLVNEGGIRNLIAHDQARAKAMMEKGSGHPAANQPLLNNGVAYVATVGVGCPSIDYKLIVDTGSSNTWVGAHTPYVPTSSSSKTEDTVSVSYGSGSFSGDEYIDQVSLATLVIPKQSIGVASTSTGFSNDVDGILGVGPVDLTVGTLSPDTTASIPTVTDNLFTAGSIRHNEIGIYFKPSTAPVEMSGELSWGGIDHSKTVGPVTYTPITNTGPAANYWGIDQHIQYGEHSILPQTAGIVDTGTTLILLATDAYKEYISATGAVYDNTVGLLSVTQAQYDEMKNLDFIIEGEKFELIPNGQIWPRSLNTLIGGQPDAIYLIIADLGTPSGGGLDFINGFSFLQRYYSIYDTANHRVGFAATRDTRSETN